MNEVEELPILDKVKPFVSMNESVVCTLETRDRSGAKRAGIAIGLSRHDLNHGYVVYQTVEEAEAIVALLRAGIADARRIEAGEQPLAPAGIEPQARH